VNVLGGAPYGHRYISKYDGAGQAQYEILLDEAEALKQQLGAFLREHLKLTLSDEKPLITHARSQAARFLGYAITVLYRDTKRDRRGHRSLTGQIGLKVPVDVVHAKCGRYLAQARPCHRPELRHDTPYSSVVQYQQECRGLAEY
jgi:hypothetical protein